MSNYKETSITGSTYTRCNQVLITNRLGATPIVRFDEQVVITGAGTSVVTGSGSIEVAFDPSKVVPIINPETGEPTGSTITYGELYALLYSAYLEAALARDAAQAVEGE